MKHKIPSFITGIAVTLMTTTTSAAPSITGVTAQQRYPWNGKVDISYTVLGERSASTLPFTALKVAAKDCDTGTTYAVTSLSGDVSMAAGTHAIVWDAAADLGEVLFTNMVVTVEMVDRKVQLWKDGPYWAETNIGAENPWDYGYYFWWGDTVGYKREGNAWVASDGSSNDFSFSSGNTPTYGKDDATLQSEGWITADGVLAPEHDAARVHWGGSWRMPTDAELSALEDNCDWLWTTTNSVRGYIVRGRGDFADASIFLPAAGYGYGTSLSRAGSHGYYWSSVPGSGGSYYARDLYFYSGYHGADSYYDRSSGQSVRPVQGFAE